MSSELRAAFPADAQSAGKRALGREAASGVRLSLRMAGPKHERTLAM